MRRRVGFLFICSAAIPIAIFAATAWACGSLTTLSASKKVAAPGETITVKGRNWGQVTSTAIPPTTGNSLVQLRWNSRTGPIVKEVNPTDLANGVPFTIPASASPGWYTVTGTQFNVTTGVQKSGSPGRTIVRVQGGAASSSAPWGAAKPTGSGGSGSPDVPLPGILLSAALLATGLILVARGKGKKSTRPVLGV